MGLLILMCALLGQHIAMGQQQQGLSAEDRQRMCTFFQQGDLDVGEEFDWGQGHGLCVRNTTHEYFALAAANCQSCYDGADVCGRPTMLILHQYLNGLHKTNWQANLLSFKSFLLTQDLRRSRMYLWVDADGGASWLTANPEASAFFRSFRGSIRLRRINWPRLIAGTPFEGARFFGNEAQLKKILPTANYADLLRVVLMHRFGGVWVDNDVVLLRDWRPLVVNVGLQFVPRWMNNHVLHLARGSALGTRLMRFITTLPYVPGIKAKIERICKPLGYYPISYRQYGNADIYIGCALRWALKENNTAEPAGNKFYELPLGWFDPIWARPPDFGKVILASRRTAVIAPAWETAVF